MADSTSVLDNIIAASNASLELASDAGKALAENEKKKEALAVDTAAKLKEASAATGVVVATKLAADLLAQQATIRVARSAGVDPKAQADMFVKSAQRMTAASDRINASFDKIRDIKAKSFFEFVSDPLQAIKDTRTKNAGREEIRRSSTEAAQISKTTQEVTQLINSAKVSYSATAESMTQASVEAATKMAALEQSIQANNAEIDSLKNNSAGVAAAMNTSKEQLSILHSKQAAILAEQSKQNAQVSLKHQARAADLADAKFAREGEYHADAKEAKASGKTIDDITLEKINLGFRAHGKAELTKPEFQSRKQLFQAGKDPDLALMYRSGTLTIENDGVPMLARTPLESLSAIEQAGSKVSDARDTLVRTLFATRNSAVNSAELLKLQDDNSKIQFLNTALHDKVQRDGAAITDSPTNSRYVGDMTPYLGLPGVKELPLVVKVLQPLADQKKPLGNSAEILSLVEAAVSQKLISSTEAASGMATMFQKANVIHQGVVNFRGLGLDLGKSGTKYPVPISRGWTTQNVNYTDPVEIGVALNYLSLTRAGISGKGATGAPDSSISKSLSDFILGAPTKAK